MGPEEHLALIGLGSNLGDRAKMLSAAVQAIGRHPQIRLDFDGDVASLYETAPVGGPAGQPRFLNTAARIRTSLSADDLLRALQSVESASGRLPGQRWGPRTVDIDLLLFDDTVLESQELTLPHPRMHERRFVLEPLAEVAPDALHPALGLSILQLAQQARADQEVSDVIRVAGPEWVHGLEPVPGGR